MADSRDGRATLQDVFALARDPRLEPEEKLVWLLYRSYESKEGGGFPGQETLAWHLGRSARSVRRYRGRLMDLGYLEQELRGPKPARYRAVLPDGHEDCRPPDDSQDTEGFPSSDFVDAIRKHWWLSTDLPERAPEGWGVPADLRYVRKLWSSEGVDRAMDYVRGARVLADRGELGPAVKGRGFTSAYLQRHVEISDQSLWSRALDAARDGERDGGPDEDPLSQVAETVLEGQGGF